MSTQFAPVSWRVIFFFGFGNKLYNMKRTSLCMKLKDIVHIISKKLYFCKLSQGYRPSKSNKFQSYILPNLSKFYVYVLIRLLRISIHRPYRFDLLLRINLSSVDKAWFDKSDISNQNITLDVTYN